MIGIASISRTIRPRSERLGDAVPNLLTYLGVASVLGVAGSLLLARRVKRQTLGMEPSEITGLVENREAMLHGLKEGVVALDPHERITVANDSARALLGLPADCVGKKLHSLAVEPALKEVLTREQPGPDRLVLVGDRLVVLQPRAHPLARPGHRIRHHAARPHRTVLAGAGTGRHPHGHRHPPRPGPRIRQPAARDLRPDPDRRIRFGGPVRQRRHAWTGPGSTTKSPAASRTRRSPPC